MGNKIKNSKTICLNMIVKNESKIIRRCLDSVKPIIDCWAIVDTGSDDGTQDIIRDCLKDIPGELCKQPWVNFAKNRSDAFLLAKDKADYTLVIDADEELRFSSEFRFPELKADVYVLDVFYYPSHFHREVLLSNRQDWFWEGVLHEQLTCKGIKEKKSIQIEILRDVVNFSHTDGHRNDVPLEKYLNDAALLEEELKKEPNNSRYVFYLAQSYSMVEKWDLALKNYEKRAKMGGWPQEIYHSLYMTGSMQEKLGFDRSIVLDSFAKAYQFRPKRAEPIARIALNYIAEKNYLMAYIIAKFGLGISLPPNESMFVEHQIYDYGFFTILIEAAFHLGKYQEAIEACESILSKREKVPQILQEEVERNMDEIKRVAKIHEASLPLYLKDPNNAWL